MFVQIFVQGCSKEVLFIIVLKLEKPRARQPKKKKNQTNPKTIMVYSYNEIILTSKN